MNTHTFSDTLSTLMRELVRGSPDPRHSTYMLNRGDRGLLDSLENVSAAAASAPNAGGASIAAHADHLRYGIAFLNRWARGEAEPWKDADWTESWKKGVVTELGVASAARRSATRDRGVGRGARGAARRATPGARLDRRERGAPRVSSRRDPADRSRGEGTDSGGRAAGRGGAEERRRPAADPIVSRSGQRSLHRRPPLAVTCRLLERVRHLQHAPVAAMPADDLQPHGQPARA